MKLVEQIPDLEHCWIRYAPRPWPGESGDLWLDLASSRLGPANPPAARMQAELDLETFAPGPFDDLVYLPPVESRREAERGDLADRLVGESVPVLLQVIAGRPAPGCKAPTTIDVLNALVTGDLEALSSVAAGTPVVWPLISGYTDDPQVWQLGIGRLAAAGATSVFGIVPDLTPAERRRIVEAGGERGFEALFHGSEPSARAFAAVVHRQGLEPLPGRPASATPGRRAQNRFLAGQLALIGHLWLRLGRGEAPAQAYFRAARWVERESHDLSALAGEGNLGIVSWLDDESRRQLEEIAASGSSRLLEALREEYLDYG